MDTTPQTPISEERLARHEAGHLVLSRLLRQFLTTNGVSLDQPKLQSGIGIPDSLAGSNIAIAGDTPPHNLAFGIMLLAGIIGDTAHAWGIRDLKAKKESIIRDPDILVKDLGGGDLAIFNMHMSFYSEKNKINPLKSQSFCLEFLIDFTSENKILDLITLLAEEILKTTDKSMNQQQLDEFFDKNEVSKIITELESEYISRINAFPIV